MLHYKKNSELLEELDQYIVGHEKAKKILINLVNRSKMRHYQKWILGEHKDRLIEPLKVLLIGASGSGKTYLVECLQNILDFPLLKLDATRFTLTSASGGIKGEEILAMVESNAKEYHDRRAAKGYTHSIDGIIDQTVVFIDEIDKLAWGINDSQDWNKRTQAGFLKVIENYEKLSGVSFIFAGAFNGMLERNKQLKSIGFNSSSSKHSEEAVLEDLVVKYGLIPELVGRINSIVSLDELSKDSYRQILKTIILPAKYKDYTYFNIIANFICESQIEEIVEKAIKSDQGVRFIKREVDKLFIEQEFDYENNQVPDLLLLENLQ